MGGPDPSIPPVATPLVTEPEAPTMLKRWLGPSQSCPRVTFLDPDPTRPDPTRQYFDPTWPAIADKKSDSTRPTARPFPHICIIVQLNNFLFIIESYIKKRLGLYLLQTWWRPGRSFTVLIDNSLWADDDGGGDAYRRLAAITAVFVRWPLAADITWSSLRSFCPKDRPPSGGDAIPPSLYGDL